MSMPAIILVKQLARQQPSQQWEWRRWEEPILRPQPWPEGLEAWAGWVT